MKKNLILFCVSIIAGLFLLELLIRVFNLSPPTVNYIGYFRLIDNPKIMYELIPGSLVDGGIVNKQGFRDKRDFIIKKPKNVVRIAMLGDSIIQGLGVSIDSTFSSQLENILNQEVVTKKSNLRYEVMNFGVGGYNLEAEVETLRLKVLQYDPDVVIFNLFYNDNDPMPCLGGFFNDSNDTKQKIYLMQKYAYNHNSPVENLIRKMLFKSELYIFLRERISNLNAYKRKISTLEQRCASSDWGMESISQGFSEIKRLGLEYHFKLLICIHSHLLFGEHPNNKKFADISQSIQVPYFHMIGYYKKEGVGPDMLRLKDNKKDMCHPNNLGHEIIAKAMLIELRKYNYL